MMKSLMTTAAVALLAVSAQPSFAQSKTHTSASKSSASMACPDEAALMKGANKNKNEITQAERQKVRTNAFDALDRDHDGMVSRTEYVDCLVETPAFREKGDGAAAVKK